MSSVCSHSSPVSFTVVAPPERTTVLIVDDRPLIRLALRALLGPEYFVVGEAPNDHDVIHAVEELRPAVVLLGLSETTPSGVDVLRELAPFAGRSVVVALGERLDFSLAEQALRLGARAFIPKDGSLAELRYGIETARTGGRFLSPALERPVVQEPTRFPREYQRLTTREQEVVQLIGVGLTTGIMATRLGVSYRTVHFHRTNIRRKLGFRTEWEMTRFALEVRRAL
jgi:DNA-binding NarL/FixJ family response regulator